LRLRASHEASLKKQGLILRHFVCKMRAATPHLRNLPTLCAGPSLNLLFLENFIQRDIIIILYS